MSDSFPDGVPRYDDFDRAYGEPFARAIDMGTWRTGENLIESIGRIEHEVSAAVGREEAYSRRIRATLFPLLPHLGRIAEAGVWRSSAEVIDRVHRGILFNGGIEASNGMSIVHETMPLTITQIGVCLVSYDGAHGNWAHRLFRRDLREEMRDPVAELERVMRSRRDRAEGRLGSDALSELARRGMMAFAERSALRLHSRALWRMGHGSPLPFELLSELWTANEAMVGTLVGLMRWFANFKRFVFVPSRPRRRDYLMLGNALRSGEYAILGTMRDDLASLLDRLHLRADSPVRQQMDELIEEIAPSFVTGVYRASETARPFLFHAHREHAHLAAHIALADAQLQQMRGFPMLLDLAAAVCRSTFGLDSLTPLVQTAYGMHDEPLRYVGV